MTLAGARTLLVLRALVIDRVLSPDPQNIARLILCRHTTHRTLELYLEKKP